MEIIQRDTSWEGDQGDKNKGKGIKRYKWIDSCRIDMEIQSAAWGRWCNKDVRVKNGTRFSRVITL